MATKTRLSLEEFLGMPGIDDDRLELIDGEVAEKPMPTWGHGRIAGRLFTVLDQHGFASVEPRAIIPGTADRKGSSPIPDVAFYLAEPPSDADWMTRPPDIAIEVLSPGQSRQEMRAKVDLYRDFGVRSVWVVDPESATIEVYEGGARESFSADEAVRCSVAPGLELTPSTVFESQA